MMGWKCAEVGSGTSGEFGKFGRVHSYRRAFLQIINNNRIPSQLCIVAFAFGDGFSNVLYPTNAALLISLGLADVSYGKWFRWSISFQLINLLLTSGLLLLGPAADYGL